MSRAEKNDVTAGMPSAPWRFSTTIGWPHFGESRSAMTRALRSMPLPGGNGTIACPRSLREILLFEQSHEW